MKRRYFSSLLASGACAVVASNGTQQALAQNPACTSPPRAGGISEQDFRDYIAAFNRSDFDGFSQFYADNVEFHGRAGHFFSRDDVLAFYREVKSRMRETITVHAIAVGEDELMAELETELVAFEDWPDFATGPLAKGDVIVSQNFVWYEISNRQFVRIRSANFRRIV